MPGDVLPPTMQRSGAPIVGREMWPSAMRTGSDVSRLRRPPFKLSAGFEELPRMLQAINGYRYNLQQIRTIRRVCSQSTAQALAVLQAERSQRQP